MSISRRRRLEALERRQIRGPVWTDPFDSAMALWAAFEAEHAATKANREFSRVPRPEREPMSPEAQAPFDQTVKDADRMAARLVAEQAQGAQLLWRLARAAADTCRGCLQRSVS